MYKIINTYPENREPKTADIRISAARTIYKELLKLWEEKKEESNPVVN